MQVLVALCGTAIVGVLRLCSFVDCLVFRYPSRRHGYRESDMAKPEAQQLVFDVLEWNFANHSFVYPRLGLHIFVPLL
eukprot:scaffold539310_cov29-Prasinocladus_malaysianus.AAC.1